MTITGEVKEIEEKVRHFIETQQLVQPGQKLVVAVSGGADSMALLHFLWNYYRQEICRGEVVAAHLDHCLRPGESAQERQMVIDYCRQNGIPLLSQAIAVKEWAREHGVSNLEEAARTVRYGFLRQAAKICGANRIATAHHQDDQAETILMHLLRGSGMPGLGGMAPQNGRIIRPFLAISKKEILAYCAAYRIPYCTDQSNFDQSYLRNRIRWELLPLLQQYNPQVTMALTNLGEICREENQYLEGVTAAVYEKMAPYLAAGEGSFAGENFLGLPLALRRRFLQYFFRKFQAASGIVNYTSRESLSFRHIQAIMQLKTGEQTVLPGHIFCRREEEKFIFSRKQPQPAEKDICYALTEITAETELIFPDRQEKIRITPLREPILAGDKITALSSKQVLVPWQMGAGICLRTRKEGDTFSPRGMQGTMKLKKYFINEKIPPGLREHWPLLAREQQILWVCGKRFGNMIDGNGKNRTDKNKIGENKQPAEINRGGWLITLAAVSAEK